MQSLLLIYTAKRGFYVTADFRQAELWSRSKAKKSSSTPAVVVFEIDRQRLNLFDYKRFNVGEYQQWLAFTSFSRDGHQRHEDFDMVEGPYRVKALNGTYTKPAGHQLGIFSTDAANYFNDHVIRKSTIAQAPSWRESSPSLLPLLQGMQRLTLQRSNHYLGDDDSDDDYSYEDVYDDDSEDESDNYYEDEHYDDSEGESDNDYEDESNDDYDDESNDEYEDESDDDYEDESDDEREDESDDGREDESDDGREDESYDGREDEIDGGDYYQSDIDYNYSSPYGYFGTSDDYYYDSDD